MEAANRALTNSTNGLAKTLLDQNNGDTNSQTANVTLSLVTFSNTASVEVDKTADSTTFNNAIPTTANGGTNWEDALTKANNIKTRTYTENGKTKNATKYVIFVSDGDPTFRNSSCYYYGRRDPDDDRSTPDGIHGSGDGDKYGLNYYCAAEEAKKIGSNFYGLGVFGNVANMQNLVSESGADARTHYFSVNNYEDLQTALSRIAKSITNSADFKNITITDNITDLTSTALVNGKIYGMTVKVTDNSGADVTSEENVLNPSYTANTDRTGQKITWSLGSDYHLKNGYTYSVTFKVWPSQEAYDLVADLNNGTKTYESLTDIQKKQIKKSESGFALATNTESGNTVSYTRVDTKTENGQTTTDEHSGSVDFTNPDPIQLHETKLQIKKVWADSAYNNNRPTDIRLLVKEDGNDYKEVTLTGDKAASEWTAEVYVAPGIYVNPGNHGTASSGENAGVLENGHTYTVEEKDNNYHYELSTSPIRPMLNGTTTNDTNDLINLLNKSEIYKNGEATITATNTLRGGVEISKKAFTNDGMTDISSQDGVKDKEFTFTLDTLTLPNDYSLSSTDSNFIGDDYVKNGKFAVWAEKFESNGAKSGVSYKISQGDTFTLKPGEMLRLTNIPIGTQYSVSENSATGYELFQVKAGTNGGNKNALGNNTTVASGTTTGNTNYEYEFDNKQMTTSIVIQKTTDDYGTLLGGSTFKLYKKNASGIYEAVTEKNGTLNPDATTGVTLNDLEVGDYKLTETHAPDGYIVETADTYFAVGIRTDGKGTITLGTGVQTNNHARVQDNTIVTLQIGNKAGQALPNTGGHGTLPFILGGMLLISAAGMLYIISKKRSVLN